MNELINILFISTDTVYNTVSTVKTAEQNRADWTERPKKHLQHITALKDRQIIKKHTAHHCKPVLSDA